MSLCEFYHFDCLFHTRFTNILILPCLYAGKVHNWRGYITYKNNHARGQKPNYIAKPFFPNVRQRLKLRAINSIKFNATTPRYWGHLIVLRICMAEQTPDVHSSNCQTPPNSGQNTRATAPAGQHPQKPKRVPKSPTNSPRHLDEE